MSIKKLDSYIGELKPDQIAEGINLATQNAIRLSEDAQILFNAKRYPSALALAILSIEEAGKVPILRSLSTAQTKEEVINIWRNYRSHVKKNVLWPILHIMGEGVKTLDDFRPIFNPNSEHPYLLDQLKQTSIYTDCLGKANWSEPLKVIDKDLAKQLIQIAKILPSKRKTTSMEIELWVKHMKNIDQSDEKKSKEALFKWYGDMKASGLLSKQYKMEEISKWIGFSSY